ncbi:hypothetical protein QOT17_009867 [Balamuthia mandrillaris]
MAANEISRDELLKLGRKLLEEGRERYKKKVQATDLKAPAAEISPNKPFFSQLAALQREGSSTGGCLSPPLANRLALKGNGSPIHSDERREVPEQGLRFKVAAQDRRIAALLARVTQLETKVKEVEAEKEEAVTKEVMKRKEEVAQLQEEMVERKQNLAQVVAKLQLELADARRQHTKATQETQQTMEELAEREKQLTKMKEETELNSQHIKRVVMLEQAIEVRDREIGKLKEATQEAWAKNEATKTELTTKTEELVQVQQRNNECEAQIKTMAELLAKEIQRNKKLMEEMKGSKGQNASKVGELQHTVGQLQKKLEEVLATKEQAEKKLQLLTDENLDLKEHTAALNETKVNEVGLVEQETEGERKPENRMQMTLTVTNDQEKVKTLEQSNERLMEQLREQRKQIVVLMQSKNEAMSQLSAEVGRSGALIRENQRLQAALLAYKNQPHRSSEMGCGSEEKTSSQSSNHAETRAPANEAPQVPPAPPSPLTEGTAMQGDTPVQPTDARVGWMSWLWGSPES